MTYSTWQEEVEAFVKEKKILKKDLAEAIGVTPVKLSHWLHGRTFFNRTILERLAAFMDDN